MMITNFKLFEDYNTEEHEQFDDLYSVIRGNSYSIPAWMIKEFQPDGWKKGDESYIVIFDYENDTYGLVHDYYIFDEESDYLELSNSKEMDLFDKDAVMKVVDKYIEDFEMNQNFKKYNI